MVSLQGSYRQDREQIFAWLKSSNHTFCFLQETHSGVNTHSLWEQEWGHEAYFSGDSNNSEGVGILINPKVSYAVHKYTEIIVGRLQALERGGLICAHAWIFI